MRVVMATEGTDACREKSGKEEQDGDIGRKKPLKEEE